MTTLTEARDIVAKAINDAWANVTGGAIPLLWDNVRGDTDPLDFYGRATIRVTSAVQTTQGTRRYETTGNFVVQLFGAVSDGWTANDAIAQALMNELRSTTGSPPTVWLFEVFPTELGIVEDKAQTNINGTFRYQETVA